MKSTKGYRILTLAVMVIMLTALFTIAAFAEVVGGYGEIIVTDSNTYKMAAATINSEGNGLFIDKSNAKTISKETNTGLAGLYAVSADDFATQTLVYVHGDLEDRKVLGEKWASGDINVSTGEPITDAAWIGKTKHASGYRAFAPGYFAHNATIYPQHNMTCESHFSNAFVSKFYAAEDMAAKQAVVDEYKDVFTNHVVKYALATDEILPVEEFDNLVFHLNGSVVNTNIVFNTYDSKVKFNAYIMAPDGTVTSHAFYFDHPSQVFDANHDYAFTVSFDDADTWEPALPQKGYFIAFEYYPFYGLTKAENFEIYNKTEGAAIENVYANRARGIFPMPSWTITLPKTTAPIGITANGSKFEGLDADVTYYVAPVVPGGFDESKEIEVSKVSSYTLPENTVGLYGIYFKGDDTTCTNSKAGALIYIPDTYANRSDIGENDDENLPLYSKKTEAVLEWAEPGTMAGGDWYKASGAFKSDWMYYPVSSKDLYSADANGDTVKAASLRKTAQGVLAKISYRYAFTTSEVSPIADVVSMQFSRAKQNGGITVNAAASKLVLYVMGTDGTISTYSQLSTTHNVTNDVVAQLNHETFDIQSFEGLPSEGWLIGYKYYPMAKVEASAIIGKENGDTHYSVMVRTPCTKYTNYYALNKSKLPTPTGITVDGTTFKGLDANKTYVIAPYTKVGIYEKPDTEFIKKTVSGVSEVDITTLYEAPVGLYGIYFDAANDSLASDVAAVIYVNGTFAARKDIGVVAEGAAGPTATVGTSSTDWVVGSFRGAHYSTLPVATDKGYRFMDNDSGIYAIKITDLLAAEESGDEAAIKAAKEAIIKSLQSRSIRYAYCPDEIVPISQMNTLTVGSYNYTGTGHPLRIVAAPKLFIYVAAPDGKITEHVWIGTPYSQPQGGWNTTSVQVVDVQSIEGIPSEGWVVGIKYQQLADIAISGVNYSATATITSSNYATATLFGTGDNYGISKPKIDAPTGITVDGTVINGLDENKEYKIASFTIEGADVANAKTVTGATKINIDSLFADAVGLYGIYFDGNNEFEESKATIVYISGDIEERKAIGEPLKFTIEGFERDGYVTYAGNSDYETAWNTYKLVWHPGLYSGYRNYYNNTVNYFYFSDDWSARGSYSAKDLTDALVTEDPSDELPIQTAFQTLMKKQTLRYSYLPKEIIPVNQLVSVSYGVFASHGFISPSVQAKLNIHVMLPDSTVKVYSALTDKYIPTSSSKTQTFDIHSIEDLPEEGWVVGIEFLPAGEVAIEDIVSTSTSAIVGFELAIIPGSYVIADGAAPIVERSGTHTFTITNYANAYKYEYAVSDSNEVAPEDGWTTVTAKDITIEDLEKYVWVKRLASSGFEASEAVVSDKASEPIRLVGTSLILDGTIGIKITFEHSENISKATLWYTLVNGKDRTMCQEPLRVSLTGSGTSSFTLPMLPKYAKTAHYETNLDYTGANGSGTIGSVGNLSVYKMIEIYKADSATYADALPLVEALETYYLAAADYFESIGAEDVANLTDDELADLASKMLRAKTGTINNLEFYATSLILEDDTAIRHYFKITNSNIKTEDDLAEYFSVEGGTPFKFAKDKGYVYTEIKDISSVDLDKVMDITITEKDSDSEYKVSFNALAYVDLCLNSEDAKLANLVKALYRYSVESDNYAK